MSEELEVCHHRNKQEHYKRNCPELLIKSKGKPEKNKKHSGGKDESGRGTGQRWFSHHTTTMHSESA